MGSPSPLFPANGSLVVGRRRLCARVLLLAFLAIAPNVGWDFGAMRLGLLFFGVRLGVRLNLLLGGIMLPFLGLIQLALVVCQRSPGPAGLLPLPAL